MRRNCVGTVACLVVAVVIGHAQSPASPVADRTPSPAAIGGVVVDAASREPIRHARVALASDVNVAPALTGEDGRFAVTPTRFGRHTIVAAKAGFATTEAAIAPPPPRSLPGDAMTQTSSDIEIRMEKGGVIEGRVADEFGEPVPLITVIAERVVGVGARSQRKREASADTDDLGKYRLFGLPAGAFVVAVAGNRVELSRGRAPAPHNYYPHATDPDQADVIDIEAGEIQQGIDLSVQSPSRPPRASITPSRRPRRDIHERRSTANADRSRGRSSWCPGINLSTGSISWSHAAV